MPNIIGSFSGRVVSQATVSLHDASDHDMNLMQVSGLQKSSDPDWNNARITYWGTADLLAGSGPQRGYFVNEHADGDRDLGTFEGKITTGRRTSDSRGQLEIHRRHRKVFRDHRQRHLQRPSDFPCGV
jgi:hypothetical protein